ncbi:manganese efflux pump [Candidatus Roizmanbacteria bacterium]|nr:manganese efflux pump [Candidatus Roizmanbacteria bacterium]
MLLPFLIAISLNFDTFSVAVVEGATSLNTTLLRSVLIGLCFAIGQAGMALIGSLLGIGFSGFVSGVDHWIAFFLLGGIGLNMIRDSRDTELCNKKKGTLKIRSLLFLIIATSIDALVVGITLAFLKQPILQNVAIIAITTFITAFTGYSAGDRLKNVCQNKVKIIGGAVLICIGIKILIEHLFFS